jgi:hypothetical protein
MYRVEEEEVQYILNKRKVTLPPPHSLGVHRDLHTNVLQRLLSL